MHCIYNPEMYATLQTHEFHLLEKNSTKNRAKLIGCSVDGAPMANHVNLIYF